MGAAAGPAGSGGHPGGAGQDPGARAGADPVRAHGRLAVCSLPRRGGADGLGSGAHAHIGYPGAGVRGCAPAELRHVRRAGPAAGVRRQRFRRDAAGAVRVGRQAAGGQLRHRRPRARVRRPRRSHRGAAGCPQLPHRDVPLRVYALFEGLVLQDRHQRGHPALRLAPAEEGGGAPPGGHRQGAPEHQPEGVPEDVRPGRGAVPDPAGPPGDRPLPHRAPPRGPRRTPARHRAVPGDAASGPA